MVTNLAAHLFIVWSIKNVPFFTFLFRLANSVKKMLGTNTPWASALE